MTTQYTPLLKLALPVTGELSGTWGDVVNDNITSMVEQAVAGLSTINTWTANSHTLTTANGTTSEARCAMLVADDDGAGNPSAAATIICPASSKLYVLKNISGQTVTLKTSGGSGVAVQNNDTAFLFCDGTNVEACVTTIVNGHISGNLTVDGNTTLGDGAGDTVTINAGTTTVTQGTANTVLYLNASKVISGAAGFTYNGTTLTIPATTTGSQITSTLATGTAPLVIASTTKVANLNVDLLDGADWAAPGAIGSTTPSTGAFTTLSATGNIVQNAGTVQTALSYAGALGVIGTLTNHAWQAVVNSTEVGRFSSTGLAVTGALSATGALTTAGLKEDASGNLGLGVTPSAWAANYVVFQQALGGGALVTRADSVQTHLASNWFYDGADKYYTGGAASRYTQISGQHQWYNAPAGTAGNAITFTQAMALDASGNLGIGTSNPNQKLVISNGGAAGLEMGPTILNSAPALVSYNRSGGAYLQLSAIALSHVWQSGSTPTETMRLDASGNLGLGVTPSAWGGQVGLQVGLDASLSGRENTADLMMNAYFDGINYRYVRSFFASRYQQQDGFHRWSIAPSGTAGTAITFTQAMTLDASGRLGIGITNPAYPLVVSNAGGAGLEVAPIGLSSAPLIQAYNRSGSAYVQLGFDASQYVWRLGGTETMRVDNSGNLGLGVTPSAWTAGKALQLYSTTSLFNDGTDTYFGNNFYYSSGWKYLTTAAAMQYQQGASGHKWYTAPSGTAGAAITFTQAMTLTAAKEWLLGTTSSASSVASGGVQALVDGFGTGQTTFDIGHITGTPTTTQYQRYFYNGTAIGSVTQSGTTAVAYNTTSDHRLKTNVRPADANRFMDIEFVDFEWTDGRHDCGVIADQLQSVYPSLVLGEKDATEVRTVEITPAVPAVLDEEGNVVTPEVPAVTEEQTLPVYQQVNYIGLIGRMGTVIQKQQRMLEALEARIAALEAA